MYNIKNCYEFGSPSLSTHLFILWKNICLYCSIKQPHLILKPITTSLPTILEACTLFFFHVHLYLLRWWWLIRILWRNCFKIRFLLENNNTNYLQPGHKIPRATAHTLQRGYPIAPYFCIYRPINFTCHSSWIYALSVPNAVSSADEFPRVNVYSKQCWSICRCSSAKRFRNKGFCLLV